MVRLKTTSRGGKRALYIFGILLAINLGVARILIKQLSVQASTRGASAVKDEQVITPNVGAITANDTVAPLSSESDTKPIISTYTVVKGDTLSGIAEKFSISVNTIRWANNLGRGSAIHEGDMLTILPVTGIEYKIKKGDTLSGIAHTFSADQADIVLFNSLDDTKVLKVGMDIIIPDAEPLPALQTKKNTPVIKKDSQKISEPATVAPSKATPETKPEPKANDGGLALLPTAAPTPTTVIATSTDYFTMPMPGSLLTQDLHGYNAVDFGAPVGTAVLAAAAGKIIVAKGSGTYNGGYGNYIVIEHDNGSQTLYAHLSAVTVSLGDTVTKGQEIGRCGHTGRATGPHLHFEVRGAKNPWIHDVRGTEY